MSTNTTISDDKNLLFSIKNGDENAFKILYMKYAKELLEYAYSLTKNKNDSEEIIQDIFESLWLKKDSLEIDKELKLYLFGATKNKILNYFRSEKVRKKYTEHFYLFLAQYETSSSIEIQYVNDLKETISEELLKLPNKCREAFIWSRFEHKNLDEIAETMGISKRTVENYITQALKHLRTALKEYHWILMMLYFY